MFLYIKTLITTCDEWESGRTSERTHALGKGSIKQLWFESECEYGQTGAQTRIETGWRLSCFSQLSNSDSLFQRLNLRLTGTFNKGMKNQEFLGLSLIEELSHVLFKLAS